MTDSLNNPKVDALRADTDDLRAALARVTEEHRKLGASLADARRQLSRQSAIAQALRAELEAVYASNSWRMTAPVRALRTVVASGRLSPKRLVRGPVVSFMRFALGRPAVKAPVMRVLSRHPAVLVRLQRLAVRAGLAAQMGAFDAARQRPSSLSSGALSPKGARVLDELINAIKERSA